MERIVLSEVDIKKCCERLGKEIDNYLKKIDDAGIPVFLGVMNGGLPFMFELIKKVETPCIVDTIQVSSYEGTSSTGKVKVTKEPDNSLKDKIVILIEDIIDTGLTMHFLKQYIKDKFQPREVLVCVLVKRELEDAKYKVDADFTGLNTKEKDFLVGFGFDYFGLYRNTPYVFIPSVKEVKEWNDLLEKEKNKKQED